MAVEFTMPKLGLTMTDGTICRWLVADGTYVNAGDPVLVIETDTVETEVEARAVGILSISGAVGNTYECGAVIGHLLAEREAPVVATPAAEVSRSSAARPQPVSSPADAPEPIELVEPVEPVEPAEPVGLVEPAVAETAVADTGVADTGEAETAVADTGVADTGEAETGEAETGEAETGEAETGEAETAVADTTIAAGNVAVRGDGGRILASPMARAAARSAGLDLDGVAGTGPSGRIVSDDIAAHNEALATAATKVAAAAAAAAVIPAVPVPRPPSQPDPPATDASADVASTSGGRMLADLLGIDLRVVPAGSPDARVTREDVAAWVRSRLAEPADATSTPAFADAPTETVPLLQSPSTVVPMRGVRAVIADRMHGSLTEMAQLTLSVDADMTAINAERARLNTAELPVPGYTAWVIAAAARSLVDHPYVNSQVTAEGVAYLPQVHVGVAVALDDGLIVPVITNADARAVHDVHRVVAELAGRARDGKLELTELEGGTFSVTALGMYGVDMFTPVINPPNTAILGVGRLRPETRWDDGVPSPRTVMTLSLTWDHRAFDGAPAAEFAQSIVRYLENPAVLAG